MSYEPSPRLPFWMMKCKHCLHFINGICKFQSTEYTIVRVREDSYCPDWWSRKQELKNNKNQYEIK